MKKYPVNFEIAYTIKELILYSDIYMFDKEAFSFCKGSLCIPLSTDFIASRLSQIEKIFGFETFNKCKLRLDEAFENYKQSINKKDEENNVQ